MSDFALQLLLTFDATLRLATPLILCAMAGIFSERSGVIDISLEGKMLAAAFVAAAVAHLAGSPWLGVLAAVFVSIFLALVHGFACITHRGNQVVSGLAINILASGLTVTIGIALFRQGGQTPPLTSGDRFRPVTWWFVDWLNQVPVIGTIYRELISGHNALVYLALVMVPLTAWLLYKTRFGLRLRAVGEVLRRWTAPVSRSSGCVIGRLFLPASSAGLRGPTFLRRREQVSCAKCQRVRAILPLQR